MHRIGSNWGSESNSSRESGSRPASNSRVVASQVIPLLTFTSLPPLIPLDPGASVPGWDGPIPTRRPEPDVNQCVLQHRSPRRRTADAAPLVHGCVRGAWRPYLRTASRHTIPCRLGLPVYEENTERIPLDRVGTQKQAQAQKHQQAFCTCLETGPLCIFTYPS